MQAKYHLYKPKYLKSKYKKELYKHAILSHKHIINFYQDLINIEWPKHKLAIFIYNFAFMTGEKKSTNYHKFFATNHVLLIY